MFSHSQSPAGHPLDFSDLTFVSSFQALIILSHQPSSHSLSTVHAFPVMFWIMGSPEANNSEVHSLATGVRAHLGSS